MDNANRMRRIQVKCLRMDRWDFLSARGRGLSGGGMWHGDGISANLSRRTGCLFGRAASVGPASVWMRSRRGWRERRRNLTSWLADAEGSVRSFHRTRPLSAVGHQRRIDAQTDLFPHRPPIGQLLSPIFAAKSGIRWLIDLPAACSANQRHLRLQTASDRDAIGLAIKTIR